jgi:hypothetical protein
MARVRFEPTTSYSKMVPSQNVLILQEEIVSNFNCMYYGEPDETLRENRK